MLNKVICQKVNKIIININITFSFQLIKIAIIMQVHSKTIDISTMHKYSTHKNIPWNICEYQPVPEYLDHQLIAASKGNKKQSAQLYITKKQCFIDKAVKITKDNPSPDKYNHISDFDQTLNKKHSKKVKINPRLTKHTYLEQIQNFSKTQKRPSVGKYHLFKNQKEIAEQIKKMNKFHKKRINQTLRHFYDFAQSSSLLVPGAGNYNPHEEVVHVKQPRTDYKFWIDKHRKQSVSQTKRQKKKPDPGTYRPVSASFRSFDKIAIQVQKETKKNSRNKRAIKNLGFGSSDTKFQYCRVSKQKIKQKRPQPNKYDVMIEWKGKNDENKKKGWIRCLSAGPTRSTSIYHSN